MVEPGGRSRGRGDLVQSIIFPIAIYTYTATCACTLMEY